MQICSFERLVHFHIHHMERSTDVVQRGCSKAAGHEILTNLVVVDLDGLSYSRLTSSAKKLMETVSKMDQDNYPE